MKNYFLAMVLIIVQPALSYAANPIGRASLSDEAFARQLQAEEDAKVARQLHEDTFDQKERGEPGAPADDFEEVKMQPESDDNDSDDEEELLKKAIALSLGDTTNAAFPSSAQSSGNILGARPIASTLGAQPAVKQVIIPDADAKARQAAQDQQAFKDALQHGKGISGSVTILPATHNDSVVAELDSLENEQTSQAIAESLKNITSHNPMPQNEDESLEVAKALSLLEQLFPSSSADKKTSSQTPAASSSTHKPAAAAPSQTARVSHSAPATTLGASALTLGAPALKTPAAQQDLPQRSITQPVSPTILRPKPLRPQPTSKLPTDTPSATLAEISSQINALYKENIKNLTFETVTNTSSNNALRSKITSLIHALDKHRQSIFPFAPGNVPDKITSTSLKQQKIFKDAEEKLRLLNKKLDDVIDEYDDVTYKSPKATVLPQ